MAPKVERGRLEIRIPVKLLARIDAFQAAHDIPTRTMAVLELLRRALEQVGF
jgi:metal-responsive CopG/Arc/MetJ family transcriptional regulator